MNLFLLVEYQISDATTTNTTNCTAPRKAHLTRDATLSAGINTAK
jgi:hypothetical protein